MVQWLRIHHPMQGDKGSLARELRSHRPWGNQAHVSQPKEPMHCNKSSCLPQLRLDTAKNK